jgi:hypothetical protein
MIVFSNTVADIQSQPVVESFYMVRIGNYRTTNYFTEITLSDNQLFVADGRLVSVDTPRLSSYVDREVYKCVLADSDFVLGYMVDNNIVGSVFEVRIGFVNGSTGLPVTTIRDTILAYSGIVDTSGYNIKTDAIGETLLQVSGASPMADLDATRPFYGGKDWVRKIYPNDASFDQVYEGSGAVNIRWGKG